MRMTDWKRAIWGSIVGLVALTLAQPARAQIPEAVYSDAKDIIEELLTTEIAHQVAPGIACLSGQTDVDATDPRAVSYTYVKNGTSISKHVRLEATTHFPKTLQLVYNRQFGRLRGTIRDESANLAGYLVHEALHAAALEARPLPEGAKEANVEVVDAVARAVAQVEKAVQNAPTDLENPPDDPVGQPAPRARIPRFDAISAEEFGACKSAVVKPVDPKTSSPNFSDGSWGGQSTYPLDDQCKNANHPTIECHLAYAVRSGLLGQSAATQDHLVKAAALVVREVASVDVDPSDKGSVHELDVIERQALFLLRKTLSGDTWDAKSLEEAVISVAKASAALDLRRLNAATRTELFALLTSLASVPSDADIASNAALAASRKAILDAIVLSGGPSAPEAATKVAQRLIVLVRLLARLEEVHAAWRSVVNVETGKIDLVSFLRVVAGEEGPLDALCKDRSVPACALIAKLPLIGRPGDASNIGKALTEIRSILVYSARGESAEATQMAVGYLFQKISKGNNVEVSVHQRFVQSVAGYVLDASDGQAPSETARVAFRKASVEMIQHLGQGTGIRRRYATWCSALKIFFLPDLALRASWSPSYVNQDQGSARILASANWLNVRARIHRTEATYVGVELSLVDPLAPLSELALRKTDKTHYRKVNNLFGAIFAPRIEFLAASPMLSEHLGVSAGVSIRGTAPVPDSTPRSDGEASYRYAPFWTKDRDAESLFPRFLEFGFALKYLL
jgi:hypothetical protein